jgi:excinuclease ABC subunit A
LKGGPWQSITILIHRQSEIDTPAFKEFLAKAVQSFKENIKRLQTRPEDVMPWKLNGERWHLGEKGFPPGKQLKWDRPLLPRLLDVIRAVEPNAEITWSSRAAITIKVPGVSRSWSQWRTKEAYGLACRFLGKKGQFNLNRIETFGVSPSISGNRSDADVIRLIFQRAEHLHADKLKELLAEHLRGFRETFGK